MARRRTLRHAKSKRTIHVPPAALRSHTYQPPSLVDLCEDAGLDANEQRMHLATAVVQQALFEDAEFNDLSFAHHQALPGHAHATLSDPIPGRLPWARAWPRRGPHNI